MYEKGLEALWTKIRYTQNFSLLRIANAKDFEMLPTLFLFNFITGISTTVFKQLLQNIYGLLPTVFFKSYYKDTKYCIIHYFSCWKWPFQPNPDILSEKDALHTKTYNSQSLSYKNSNDRAAWVTEKPAHLKVYMMDITEKSSYPLCSYLHKAWNLLLIQN